MKMAFSGDAKTALNESYDQGYCLLTEVMKNIFSNCDTEQRGEVSVSKLVEFIRPFLTDNLEALRDLKGVLDPNDLNPRVNAETFYKALSEWSSKLSAGTEDDFHNVTPRDLNRMDEKSFPLSQSTPRSSLGNSFLRNYVESGTLNLSNVSTYSWTGNNTNGALDRLHFEEQIHELEHQKKKLGAELERVRQELTTALDNNEVVHLDVKRLTKKIATNQKIIEHLQKENKRGDDMEEALNSSQKNVAKLKRLLSTLEKTNALLSKNLDEADAEKRELEKKITQMNKICEESAETVVALQTELTFKDQVVASLEDLTAALRVTINEQCENDEQNKSKIEQLRVEKSTMEKLLRERVAKYNLLFKSNVINRSNSFSDYSRITRGVLAKNAHANDPEPTETKALVPFTPKIEVEKFAFYNYDSPLARNRQRAPSFNSPRLLHMLERPISPHIESPTLSSSRCSKRSVDSDDCEDDELLKSTSTPDNEKRTGKHSTDIAKNVMQSVIENVVNICNHDENATSSDTPPVMYVVERSDVVLKRVPRGDVADKVCGNVDLDQVISDGNNNGGPQPISTVSRISVSPNVSICSIESTDDEMFYKIELMANSQDQCVSLLTEFNQVIDQKHADHQCKHYIKLVEYEEKILSLECELMQQQTINSKIENTKLEMDELKRNNAEHKNRIADLLSDLSTLENKLSLSRNAEQNLYSKFRSLQNSLKSSTTYITEVRIKITEYDELEARCKALTKKIDILETENETKRLKILDLNKEIETLREEVSGGNSSMRLLNLEKTKEDLELERVEFVKKILSLEHEKTALQKEKLGAMEKLLKLEKERSDSFLEYYSESDSSSNEFLQMQQHHANKTEENTKLTNLEAQNSYLEIENGKLKLTLMAERQTLKQLKDIECQKLRLESKYEIIQEEKRTLELDLEALKQHLHVEEEKRSDLQCQLETAMKEKLQKKKDFDELLIEHKTLSTENSKLKDVAHELRRLQNIHNVLKVEYEIYRQSSAEEHCKLEHKCGTLSRENSTLNDSMSCLNHKVEVISKENKELISQMEEFNTNSHHSNNWTENADTLHVNEESSKENKNLKLQVDNLTLEKVILNDSIKRKNDRIFELEKKITKLNNEVGNATRSLAIKEERLYQCNIKIKFDRCLRELTNTKKNEEEFNQIRRKLEMANRENEDLYEKLKQLQDAMAQLERKFGQELKNKEYLYDKFINMENELILANSRADRTQKECANLIDDLRQKEEQLTLLEETNSKISQDNCAVENLNKQLASLVEENCNLRTENQRLISLNNKFEVTAKKRVHEHEENRAKSPKKLSFDKLSLKTLKLEQKIEYLEEQLVNEKRHNYELDRRNENFFEENAKLVCSIEINQAELNTIQTKFQETADSLSKEKTRSDELEAKNKTIMCEITKTHEENATLRRKLLDLQDQVDKITRYSGKYSLPSDVKYSSSEQKGNHENHSDIEDLKSKLINSEINLRDVEDKLRKEEEKLNRILVHIDVVKQRLFERKLRLGKSTLNAVGSWQGTLEKFSNVENYVESVHSGEQLSPVWSYTGPLDEEMFQLKHQVHMSSMLLDNFTAMKKYSMQTCEAAVQTSSVESITSEADLISRRSKIFALKPATLIIRSASPDSPSAEIFSKFGTPKSNIVFKKSHSPDSAGDNIPGPSGIFHNENVSDESLSFSEYFDTYGEANPLNLETVSMQEVLPNTNHNLLEDLGLLGENISLEDLSEEEMEEKYMALVEAFTLDTSTLKDRCTKQIITLTEKETALAVEIANLEFSLQAETIASSKENISIACTQVSMAASHYGGLKYEKQHANAMDLIIKYVAMLQQKLQKTAKSTSSLQPFKITHFVTKSSVEDERKPILSENRENLQNFDKSKSNKNCYCLFVSIIFLVFLGFIYLNILKWKSLDGRCVPFLTIEQDGVPPI